MSTPKPPTKPPGGKPFLGDDDLVSELDAWDATFDALHGDPEAGASSERLAFGDATSIIEPAAADSRSLDRLGSEFDYDGDAADAADDPDAPVIEPVEPELDAADDPDAPVIEPVEPELDESELDEPELDEPELDEPELDHGGYGRRASSVTGVEVQPLEDPLEADFSDIAGDRRNRRTMPPPIDDDEVPSIRIHAGPGHLRPPSDDDVFTSASRPNQMVLRGAPDDDDDDGIAPPPPPPEPRRGPAIVRRPMPQPISSPTRAASMQRCRNSPRDGPRRIWRSSSAPR